MWRRISQSRALTMDAASHRLPTSSRRPVQNSTFFQQTRWPRPRRAQQTRQQSTGPGSSSGPGSTTSDANLSLSQRLRKLSREYGWSALGVYLALSALDFPFCFLAVRVIGTERIGHLEHVVVSAFWKIVPYPKPVGTATAEALPGEVEGTSAVQASESDAETAVKPSTEPGWGVQEAEARNKSDASMSFLSRRAGHGGRTDQHSIMDATSTSLRHSQILHLPPRAAHGSGDAKGRQGTSRLGLGHW